MSNYVRSKAKEKAFEKRYNRSVIVYQWIQSPNQYSIKIVDNGKDYVLTEYLKKGAPVRTTVTYDGETREYPLYIFAELDVADKLGED